ncbi:MAG: hypothetical protein PUC12_09170 [Clostridiales bacterium]|nr:hypothetical protein [Clostridiales bacterium]
MAKTIKFNLILDGYPVRNIEGLREHFSIEDMLDYFQSGLLKKWLEVRNYTDELEKVEKLEGTCVDNTHQTSDAKDDSIYRIATELIKIFGLETDDKKIQKDLAIFNYITEKQNRLEKYEKNLSVENKIIADYHAGYDKLIQHMVDNAGSMSLLKADVFELEKSYFGLFKLNYYELYFRLVKEAPKAIYAMFTRSLLREFYLGEDVPSQIERSLKTYIIPLEKIHENIEEDITVVHRDTKGVWDPIEREGVQVMVLYVETYGSFVMSYQGLSKNEKLGAAEVNGKFVLLDGLQYTCGKLENELVYMEI